MKKVFFLFFYEELFNNNNFTHNKTITIFTDNFAPFLICLRNGTFIVCFYLSFKKTTTEFYIYLECLCEPAVRLINISNNDVSLKVSLYIFVSLKDTRPILSKSLSICRLENGTKIHFFKKKIEIPKTHVMSIFLTITHQSEFHTFILQKNKVTCQSFKKLKAIVRGPS